MKVHTGVIIALIVVLISTLFSLNVSCENELIANNSFENGITGYSFGGDGTYELTDKYFESGMKSVHIFNRKFHSDTVKCDIKNALKEQGIYSFSVCLKLDEPAFEYSKMFGVIHITTDVGEYEFLTSTERIVNERFVRCIGQKEISWSGNIISAEFYPQNLIESEYCNFYADSFSLKREEKKPTTVNEKLLVGVLRNDKAISASEFTSGSKSSALPYYYNFGTKSFDEIGTRIQNDIDYACYAGIDYFIYNLSDETYPYHNSSKIKICFAIDTNTSAKQISDEAWYFGALKYQHIGERPLVVFLSEDAYRDKISLVKKYCEPYVAMITDSKNNNKYADITFVGCTKNTSFTDSVKEDESLWNSKQGVYVNTGASDGVAQRNSVLKHVIKGIDTAESGTKMVLINAWNDLNKLSYIQPTYLSTEPIQEKYQIDVSVLSGMHNELNGENIPVITFRSKQGEKVNSQITDVILETDNSEFRENNSEVETDYPNGQYDDSVFEDVSEETENDVSNVGTADEVEKDATEDKTVRNNNSGESATAYIIGGSIIVVAAVAVILYKFFAVGKKDDKESGNNGP